jgi:hypothetical protein
MIDPTARRFRALASEMFPPGVLRRVSVNRQRLTARAACNYMFHVSHAARYDDLALGYAFTANYS